MSRLVSALPLITRVVLRKHQNIPSLSLPMCKVELQCPIRESALRVCVPLSFAALRVPHDSCFYCLPPWTRAQMWERWGRNWRHRGAGKDENLFLVSAHLPRVVLPGTLLKRSRGTSVFLLCSELSWDGKAGVSEETSPPGALCSAWALRSTRTPCLSPPHSLLLQIPSKTPRLTALGLCTC